MRYDSCRQCTKRRIKCDKGSPRCSKCVKKGIECSGVGKTYRFATNLTPVTVETSLSAGASVEKLRQDELGASCDASSSAVTSGLQSDAELVGGSIVDHYDDNEVETISSTELEVYTNHINSHDQAQQSSRSLIAHSSNGYQLNQPLDMYKPEQVILLNHCKLILHRSCI